jgi:hypothetical protein
MVNLFKEINKKINGIIWVFASSGVLMLILAILIVWTEFVLRLVVGLFVIIVAYVLLHAAYKFWVFKKDIEKHFKF